MAAPNAPRENRARKRNSAETKARILAAAQQLFSSKGYAQAQLREIAAHADVAVSLIPEHFGSKAALFELALLEAMETNHVLDAPTSELGRAMIDHMLDDGDIRLPAMVILSIGDPVSQDITTRILRDRIVSQLAVRLGPPDGHARAMEITMIATGFMVYTRQLPVGAVAPATRERMAGILQAIVDEGR